jgi:hypothetical protein
MEFRRLWSGSLSLRRKMRVIGTGLFAYTHVHHEMNRTYDFSLQDLSHGLRQYSAMMIWLVSPIIYSDDLFYHHLSLELKQ